MQLERVQSRLARLCSETTVDRDNRPVRFRTSTKFLSPLFPVRVTRRLPDADSSRDRLRLSPAKNKLFSSQDPPSQQNPSLRESCHNQRLRARCVATTLQPN